MSTVTTPREKVSKPSAATPMPDAPPLVEGHRLDQPTFHARYEVMPPGFRAELIGGVVSFPGRVGYEHGESSACLGCWLAYFQEFTRGVDVLGHVTVILDGRNEPQPDMTLRILPECGGRTRDEDGYVVGVPEMIAEVSKSSRFIDLGPKLAEYERAGVLEYLVRAFDPDEVLWHVLQEGRLAAVPPDEDGLYHSRVFPGLWLDPQALLALDTRRLREVIDLGAKSPEHAAFVAKLASAREKPAG